MPQKHASAHICYQTKFRRCRSNHLVVGRGPQNLGDAGAPPPWDDGVADTVGTWSIIPVLSYHISSPYVKRFGRNYENPPENFDPLCPAFQDHSRSLELTRIDRLPMTSY